MKPPFVLIGRKEELERIKANLAKHQHTLLTGSIGIGKSHLLKYISNDLKKVIYIEEIKPIKQALISIAEILHKDSRLKIEGIVSEYLEWTDLKSKVTALSVKDLLGCIVEGIKGEDYILILDHLEEIVSSTANIVSSLMDEVLVLAASTDLKDKENLSKIWWAFDVIELKGLSKNESLELLWQYADETKVKDKRIFENRILNHSRGNPLAIIEMARKTEKIEFDSPEKIEGLHHDAGLKYFDLTPILLVIGAIVVAARFVALGLDDVDTYILAGAFGAFFIFLRYFIYRSMRRR